MADANRVAIFQRAKEACAKVLERRPGSPALLSVVEQLDYLVALETGATTNRAPLQRLNFDVIAAREVESIDLNAAFLIYAAYAAAKHI